MVIELSPVDDSVEPTLVEIKVVDVVGTVVCISTVCVAGSVFDVVVIGMVVCSTGLGVTRGKKARTQRSTEIVECIRQF